MLEESRSALVRRNSLAELLASLPEPERQEAIAGLTSEQAWEIIYNWRGFWARENQIQPVGNWTHWLVLSGRGFGKTRTGAETVREWASKPLPGPIHLIAPTAGDIRKVMIEGPQGGLLSCYPPHQRPNYEPSKGHLITWPNGNVAYCFSADEPERLRGPQCIAEGTAILDGNGSTKPIEAVISGDFVMTRRGPRRVMRAWMADRNADVSRLRLLDGRSIIATGDHPVCVTLASNTKDLLGTRNQGIATIRRGSSCTERFGRPSADPSHQNTTFITLTEISTIIGSRIWNSSLAANTTGFTVERSLTPIRTSPWRPPSWRPKETGLSASLPESLRVSSAVPTIVAGLSGQRPSVPLPALRECGPVPSLARIEFANTVPARIARQSDSSAIAVESAMPQRAHLDLSSQGALYALTAPSHSRHAEVMDDSAVGHAPWPFMTEIVSVSACGQAPVYDLEIEDEHEFFANGILVHNCCRYWADELATWRFGQEAWDNLMFGFRLGDELRGVITTTPKPIKLLKSIISDSSTVVTKGSTYDNRANLSPQFFRTVVTKYEGTRLGRQELNAEMLTDTPGALWKSAIIDSLRIQLHEIQWDLIVRVAVAIDPAVTAEEDSDETGIIVAGLTAQRAHHRARRSVLQGIASRLGAGGGQCLPYAASRRDRGRGKSGRRPGGEQYPCSGSRGQLPRRACDSRQDAPC